MEGRTPSVQSVTVRHFAFYGERRCEVTGYITADLATKWAEDGWRIVTVLEKTEAPVFGELQEVYTF